ncbi:MAG TPA: transcriptional regulator [Geobacter sp.]|nr:transcriptional regulator [Geobacter sp.]
MKLTKASLFGLIAVLELANAPKQQISTTDIADKYGISTHHLAKVMRNLVHHGLAQAVRGVGGGYTFTGNLKRTTLLDVIQIFENLESVLDMPNHFVTEGGPIIAELQSITTEIDNLTKVVLETITLETALKSAMRRSLPVGGDAAKP